MSYMKDKMIDKMNADREAEIGKRMKKGLVCKECVYSSDPGGCPESKGEYDYCGYFSKIK